MYVRNGHRATYARSKVRQRVTVGASALLLAIALLVGCGSSDTKVPESNYPQNNDDGLESNYPQDESDGFSSGGGMMPTYVPTHDGYETDQPSE